MRPRPSAVALLLLITSGAAYAGEKAQEADALFNKARALLKADRPVEACPLLEKSHALDPALGTLLNLAACRETTGKLVSAYLLFNEAAAWADRTRETARAEAARQRASALKPKLSWLAVSTQTPVPGLTVRVDDVSLSLGATPQSVPLDAGGHDVVATADGFERYFTRVEVGAGQTVTFVVPALKPVSELQQPGPLPVAEAPVTPPSAPAFVVERRPSSSSVPVGPIALLAGGGVALAAGVGGLVWSLTTYGAVQSQQPGGPNAAMPTVTRGEFEKLGWAYPLSWVAAGVGVAALAGGAAWLILAPRRPSFALLWLPTGAAATVQGSF